MVKQIQIAPKKYGRFDFILEKPMNPRPVVSQSALLVEFSRHSRAQWRSLRHRAHRVRNFKCSMFDLFTLGLNPKPVFCRFFPFPFPWERNLALSVYRSTRFVLRDMSTVGLCFRPCSKI